MATIPATDHPDPLRLGNRPETPEGRTVYSTGINANLNGALSDDDQQLDKSMWRSALLDAGAPPELVYGGLPVEAVINAPPQRVNVNAAEPGIVTEIPK